MNRTTTLLFDLDGTLTNPALGITQCIRYALEQMGEAPAAEPLERFIGPPLEESFAQLLDRADDSRVRAAIEHYRHRFTETGIFENEVYPGIPAALTELQAAGVEMYVATAKPHVFANRIIDHFELRSFFRRVYGSELSGVRARKGELIRHLLVEENLSPSNTCMIGDRKHDIEGARENGVRSVGVVWGFGARAELEQAGADDLVESVASLTRLGTP